MELVKERFSKLLLGEDMSGSGKGVGTALAISNAITNLCGTLVTHAIHSASFGWLALAAALHLLLSPFPDEKYRDGVLISSCGCARRLCIAIAATIFGQLWRLQSQCKDGAHNRKS